MSAMMIPFPSDAVFLKNGHPVTTSRIVADVFDKRHDHVLRDIRALDCSEEFGLLNFGETSYIDQWNRKQTMFEISKDGLVFLVMGFTGAQAARCKEKYIQAFNAMEQALRTVVPRRTVEVDEVDYYKLKAELAEAKLALVTGKAPPRRRNWPPEEVDRLVALSRQGLKAKAIGEKLGRSPDSVETKQRELRNLGRL